LTEWRIVNDEVADLMNMLNVARADRRELLELVSVDSAGETLVFFPELDPRFQVEPDGSVKLLKDADELTHHSARISTRNDDQEHDHQDHSETRETEESNMTERNDMITSILLELQAYLTRLEERDQQIPQEVMAYFHNDDLKGIERLMQERKRNAEFSTDLQELLKKWNVKAEEMVHV
jgi:hypothetical protein